MLSTELKTEMHMGKIFGSGEQPLCTVLGFKSAEQLSTDLQSCLPSRTNRTPDHSEGSPGVIVTNKPSGEACFKLALAHHEQRTSTN
jgi:hypothetical protein